MNKPGGLTKKLASWGLIAQGTTTTDPFGQLSPPPGVTGFNMASGGDIGLLSFISTLIKVGTVVAGLYVLFNVVTAGFDYITAGDNKAHQKVREKITTSLIGLVIIVASYTIMGVIGLILFGRPDYFLNPDICGPAGCSPK
jgi:hypothetical protein